MTADPMQALEDIISTGCERILTSGQRNTAVEGTELLKTLVEQAEGRIIIMAGSGVRANNIALLVKETGATEFHTTARSYVESKMIYRNPHVSMGGIPGVPEYGISLTQAEDVKLILTLAQQAKR
jgi:copper homeostasis protein